MVLLIYMLCLFSCNLTAKIATPPMYRTPKTITAMLIVQDGTPPYSYQWSNGSKKDTAVYQIGTKEIICRVRDKNGCIVDAELKIGE